MVPPPFVRAVSFASYQGRMRDAIHALKYDRLYPSARRLGRMLAAAIAQLNGEAPAEMLVVPVPLHRSKYAERGFNQAHALAFHALRFLSKSHPHWRLTLAAGALIRKRATESQAGLSTHMRRRNMRGAFVVSDQAAVAGRHVLVIDDIMTTGATVRAASKALMDSGAESVWVATLSRAYRASPAGSRFLFQDQDQNDSGFAGAAPATSHAAGRFSSHDQPSF